MSERSIEDIYHLTPLQHGLLFHSLNSQTEGDIYFRQLHCIFEADLDIDAYFHAWQDVVDIHPVIRTSFHWENQAVPLQVVRPKGIKIPTELHDWRALSEETQQRQLEDFSEKDRVQGFDFSRAPLMRINLFRLLDSSYHLVWSHHHILIDGWSLSIIFEHVHQYYKARKHVVPPKIHQPRPFGDYVKFLKGQDQLAAEKFWRETLADFHTPTPLPLDNHNVERFSSTNDGNDLYGEERYSLNKDLLSSLQQFTKQNHVTLNTIFQAVWTILLTRYSGEFDIVFGAVVSGRGLGLAHIDEMTGLLINTLPVRVQISPHKKLIDWMLELQEQQLEARQFEYCSLADIQRWSELPSGTGLFDSLLVFENHPLVRASARHEIGINIQDISSIQRTNYPLTLVVIPSAEELSMRISYERSRFSRASVVAFLEHLELILHDILVHVNSSLSEVFQATQAEKRQIQHWNHTEQLFIDLAPVHVLFEAKEKAAGDIIAVICDNQYVTYSQLNSRANQLARFLIAFGVTPDSNVGICLDRSINMAIAVLAVLKAGAAYLPLDPIYPNERLAYMLKDADARIVLTEQQFAPTFADICPAVLDLDTEWQTISFYNDTNLHLSVHLDQLVYVIYTSGSTGMPKGIGLSHRALANLLLWHCSTLMPSLRMLQFASLSFDASFHEMFATWLTGGTLLFINESLRRDTVELATFICRQSVEKIILPVVMLQQLSDIFLSRQDLRPMLKEVTTTGEQLQVNNSLKELFSNILPDLPLHNHYGPSETHVVTAYTLSKPIKSWPAHPPIGYPIANTTIYILDSDMHLVPVGVPGELYIGGVSLARGYIGRADITASRFVPDPFSQIPGARMYRTGDLAYYRSDGSLVYLRRIDNQVKIRGYRIEPGEIEALLVEHNNVSEAVVMVREHSDGVRQLVAYVVPRTNMLHNEAELRDHLKQKLPGYMIPARIIIIAHLPLTVNGKVDKRKLLATDYFESESDGIPPQTPAQKVISTVWVQLLGHTDIDVNTSFFELGGDSLQVLEIVAKLYKLFQVKISVRGFYDASSIVDVIHQLSVLHVDPQAVEQIAEVILSEGVLHPEMPNKAR